MLWVRLLRSETVSESMPKQMAQLRQAYAAGIIDEETYRTAVAALQAGGATHSESGATAQGPGAVAVGGNVEDSIIVTGQGHIVGAGRENIAEGNRAVSQRAALQERLNTQQQLLARYRDQLTLASGGEAARLQVLMTQAEDEIRLLEAQLDELDDAV